MSGEQQSRHTGTSTNFGDKCCGRLPISGVAAVSGSQCLQVQGGVQPPPVDAPETSRHRWNPQARISLDTIKLRHWTVRVKTKPAKQL